MKLRVGDKVIVVRGSLRQKGVVESLGKDSGGVWVSVQHRSCRVVYAAKHVKKDEA